MTSFSAFEEANLYVEPLRKFHDRDLEEVREMSIRFTHLCTAELAVFYPEENVHMPEPCDTPLPCPHHPEVDPNKCGCKCRCHTTAVPGGWPGPCLACCEPGMNCDCGRALA